MKKVRAIWQEHECDGCGIDFDIDGPQILAVGESVYCSGCGGYHVANGTPPGPIQTYVAIVDEEGEEHLECRPLPRDAAEKAAWIAEVGRKEL